MQRSKLPLAIGGALLLYALYASQLSQSPSPPATQPAPKVQPKAPAKPKRPDNPCPNCPHHVAEQRPAPRGHAPQLGGITSPDGTVSTIPIPDPLSWPKNIVSRGLGCCGFRSVDYLARLQNVPELVNWPESMRDDGIAGGAYPQKVEQLFERFAPGVEHWQDTSKSHALLTASIRSQRGVAVDYSGHDPHYSGGIAHCVTLVAFDQDADWVAILDNNYPELDQIVWMSVADFDKRWGGWSYGLLQQTPGYCAGLCGSESWEFFAGKDGTINYGLDRKAGNFGDYVMLNGERSSTDEIIAAIGPAMMPIPAIPVNVDHKVDLSDLKTLALFAGGGLLVFHLLTQQQRKD